MLITLTFYQHFTNIKTEEIIDELSQRDERSKERKKVKVFKTNVLVPNTKNVRRWRYRSGYLPSLWRNSAGWSRKGRTGRDSPQR